MQQVKMTRGCGIKNKAILTPSFVVVACHLLVEVQLQQR